MIPRPYQAEGLDALREHINTKHGSSPCVVVPTGGGKSAMMAWANQYWKHDAPHFRCCILAHRKELIQQNVSELLSLYPEGDAGIYSAALGRKDYDASILFASIDSIYRRSGEFTPFDVLHVDEAHRIPFKGEGKYRTFIKGCQRFNPALAVVGWTATPFRMNGGMICHKNHILNEICYEANIIDLIKDGYLCQLRSKVGVTQPELKGVKRNSGGDYTLKSLAEATNREQIVSDAVAEAVRIINAEERESVVFFCVDIMHCKKVSQKLRNYGIIAPVVTGKTKQVERDQIAENFRAGKLRAVCNVNVYTEGFNAPNIDGIVLLRPTLSPGLFSQMVGRGLRIDSRRTVHDCLVLDFAGCIDEHGPIDLLGGERTVMAVCQQCRESFSRAIRTCPVCNWEIPKQEIERLEATEKERRLHGKKASEQSILSGTPETCKVDAVFCTRHRKEGSPDSLKVQYRCGLRMFREWICLDHDGYSKTKAQAWWRERFGFKKRTDVQTVNNALENLFLTSELLDWTKTITVLKSGKFYEIIDYNKPIEETVMV